MKHVQSSRWKHCGLTYPIPHQEQDDVSSDEEPHFSLVTGRYVSSTKTRVKNNVDGKLMLIYIYR